MSTADDLVAQVLAKRERWIDLGEGKRVRLRRPAELQMVRLREGFQMEHAIAAVVGWEGFTRHDFMDDGGTEPIAFSQALWQVLVEDRAEWAAKVSETVIRLVTEHLEARGAVQGN